jgi:hypothetical protein
MRNLILGLEILEKYDKKPCIKGNDDSIIVFVGSIKQIDQIKLNSLNWKEIDRDWVFNFD